MPPLIRTRGGPDAFYTDEELPLVSKADIEAIKREIPRTTFGRTRLCAHQADADILHEMFIVLSRDTYIRPHRHFGKMESLLVLEGMADAVFFDEHGGIARIARLGDYRSGHQFFYRIGESIFHTLVIHSATLVFKEATVGPFDRSKTEFAPWSPAVDDGDAARAYVIELAIRVSRNEVS